jgi:hypothetical protein
MIMKLKKRPGPTGAVEPVKKKDINDKVGRLLQAISLFAGKVK